MLTPDRVELRQVPAQLLKTLTHLRLHSGAGVPALDSLLELPDFFHEQRQRNVGTLGAGKGREDSADQKDRRRNP